MQNYAGENWYWLVLRAIFSQVIRRLMLEFPFDYGNFWIPNCWSQLRLWIILTQRKGSNVKWAEKPKSEYKRNPLNLDLTFKKFLVKISRQLLILRTLSLPLRSRGCSMAITLSTIYNLSTFFPCFYASISWVIYWLMNCKLELLYEIVSIVTLIQR